MMSKFIRSIFISWVMVGWSLCFAQNPIFLPVDNEKAKEVIEYNKYFLMRQLYFSKRHRIVEINAELLKNRKNITLNFFEDIAIPLKLETIKDGRGSLTWLGQMQFGEEERIAIPPEYESSLKGVGLTPEMVLSHLRRVTFYVHEYDVNNKTGEAVPSAISPKGTASEIPLHSSELPDFTRNSFSSVYGGVNYLPTRQSFMVMPLQYSPKYHVVYELDNDKRYPVNIDSDEYVPTPENKRKQDAHNEFFRGVPRDEEDKLIKGNF